MSTDTSTTMTTPTGITTLPESCVSCRLCGQAAPVPADEKPVAWIVQAPPQSPTGSPKPRPLHREPMGLCTGCQDLHDQASAIARSHPRLVGRFGTQETATARIEAVLVALRLLDKPWPDPEVNDAELASLIRFFTEPGAEATWQRQWESGAVRSGTCAVHPYAAVADEHRADLLRADIDAFADDAAQQQPEMRVRPPKAPEDWKDRNVGVALVDRGCLWCGVGYVAVPREKVHRWVRDRERNASKHMPKLTPEMVAAQRRWTSHRTTRQQLSSGSSMAGAATTVSGWLCSACDEIASRHNGANQGAFETAVATFAGLGGRFDPHVHSLSGVRAWGALVIDARRTGGEPPAPAETPWQWLGSAEQIRASLDGTDEPEQDDQRVDLDAIADAVAQRLAAASKG